MYLLGLVVSRTRAQRVVKVSINRWSMQTKKQEMKHSGRLSKAQRDVEVDLNESSSAQLCTASFCCGFAVMDLSVRRG